MDLEVLKKGLYYAERRRKWGIVLGAFGFTCYGAYKVYNLPSLVEKRHRFFKKISAFLSVAEMVSDSADAIGILSKDLKQFLGSDSDQIPQRLKQLSKIAKSNEFSDSLTRITRALAIGILRGYHQDGNGDSNGFSDRVCDKLFSDGGSGFASAVVGSFARNLVMTLYSEWGRANLKSDEYVPKWVAIACDDKCRELIGDVVRLFVSTAVTVYLDKTMNINTYDEFFDGLTNPKHEARVRDMLVSLCNGAVETCVQTSYGVWSTNSKTKSTRFGVEDAGLNGVLNGKKLREKKNQESGGLMRKMRSTLGVTRNRKFVLDMTGIVTFESVRSFLEILLEKLSECIDLVHQVVVDRGVETIRYASGKSCAVSTLCLTLCLNILNSPWILVPY
ncbi:hypothetical protein ACS0TY_029256 [Phlomoides rotata]